MWQILQVQFVQESLNEKKIVPDDFQNWSTSSQLTSLFKYFSISSLIGSITCTKFYVCFLIKFWRTFFLTFGTDSSKVSIDKFRFIVGDDAVVIAFEFRDEADVIFDSGSGACVIELI